MAIKRQQAGPDPVNSLLCIVAAVAMKAACRLTFLNKPPPYSMPFTPVAAAPVQSAADLPRNPASPPQDCAACEDPL